MSASSLRSMLAATLLVAFPPAWADPPSDPARTASEMTAAATQRGGEGLAWTPEVSASLTRLKPPGPPAIGPDGRPMEQLAGVQLRMWRSHGRTDFGVGIGTVGYVQPGTGGRADGPVSLTGATPSISIGMRYRMTPDSALFADASGSRALPPDTSGAYVSTKVGMEWKPAKSRFGLDGGALGIQLDSGYKLSLKARRSGLGVYVRTEF